MNPVFEIGDSVRESGTQEVRTVVGIGSGGFLMTQIDRDTATIKLTKATSLELVEKAQS